LEAGGQLLFFCKLLPVIIMLSAFQSLLYEIVPSIVNGVIVQFLSAISLAYISGCLYPISFFPETVQNVAYFLPTGVGLRYLQKSLSLQNIAIEILLMVLFTLIFVRMQVLWRKRRIAGK